MFSPIILSNPINTNNNLSNENEIIRRTTYLRLTWKNLKKIVNNINICFQLEYWFSEIGLPENSYIL